MKLTRIDLNTWIVQIANQTVLIDPWLVDPLVFYGIPWLFTAYHLTLPAVTPQTLPAIDLILISQGVDDHCHKPTLEQLDRTIPVVASPTAAKVVEALGYQQVQAVSKWQQFKLGSLTITAVPGATIQPGQVENGYLLRDQNTGETLYYEPHLFPVENEIQHQIGQIDVAIAPVIGQIFPLLGQVIMAPAQAMQLVEALKPRLFVPTSVGEIRAEGILPKLVRSVGSVEEFRELLLASGLPTQLLTPQPGETLDLNRA